MKKSGKQLKSKSTNTPTIVFGSPKDSALFSLHKLRWNKCTLCSFALPHSKILFRGSLPCEVLIIGESPGMSDHSSKTPFPPKSPSGSILERIIEESIKPKSYGITHAIACTPFNETKTSTEPPNATEVTNCSPRIDELIQLAEPEYIIAAGKVAAKQLTKLGYEFLEIQHPTRIANQGEKGLVDLKRCILQIQEYLS